MPAESIRDLITRYRSAESADWKIFVTNRTEPDEVHTLVTQTFEGLSVEVSEENLPNASSDTLVLAKDGDVVATSELDPLMRTILAVNADVYSTGTKRLEEIDPPDVLLNLAETTFELRGYPMAHREKLVLTVLSRYIEKRAFVNGAGTLRTSFQRLSRIADELGTRQVYDRISETDVDVHVYGVPDWDPPSSMQLTVHPGTSESHKRTWGVVYRGPSDEPALALIADEIGNNVWEGFWTFDADRVRTIDRTVRSLLEPS